MPDKGWLKLKEGIMRKTCKRKYCWIAREYKVGWGLGFDMGGKRIYWLPSLRFGSVADVKRALKGNIVFIQMANSKEKQVL